jgi:hypothetical protein
MFNSSILDTLIACVVVILILSLIVQAIQTALKKILRLKSRQIEDSLIDLFENILGQQSGKTPYITRLSRWLGIIHPSKAATNQVQDLYSEVKASFAQLGRVASSGRMMLDSLSKEDLLKVLGKVAPKTLVPNLSKDLETACSEVESLDKTISEIDIKVLSGDASAKFAAMRSAIEPLINDFASIGTGEAKANVLIGDIVKLREVNLDKVTGLLGEIQTRVEKDLLMARQAAPVVPATVAGLESLVAGLRNIADAMAKSHGAFDAAISPLRTRLNEVEVWFDTVMQSFDERYTRSMKTWAIVVSLAVVVPLNANVFDLYKNVSTSTILRDTLVKNGEKIVSDAAKREKDSQDKRQNVEKEKTAANPLSLQSATTGTSDETIQGIVKETQKVIDPYMKDYANFGFRSFSASWDGWWNNSFNMIQGGTCSAWWSYRLHDLWHILGWISMALLLSVGAPFWEDTLESLFGVKKMLQSKTETKNVEQKSGAGQPKP